MIFINIKKQHQKVRNVKIETLSEHNWWIQILDPFEVYEVYVPSSEKKKQ